MAATDQAYRNQYGLDIVFAVSSILMLLSVVWMLVDDYQREYKTEQRVFRDVEVAMAQREALQKMPRLATFEAQQKVVQKAREERKQNQDKIVELDGKIRQLLPEKDRADLELSNIKANLDSKSSLYDIEVDHHSAKSEHAKQLKDEIDDLRKKSVVATSAVDEVTQKIKALLRDKENLERPLTKAIGELKKLLDDFDRQVTLSIKKQWGYSDVIRSIPGLDAYASPTKIEQITIKDLTIDYNFMGVTRFDRCTTCHKGISRPTFTKENLQDLWYEASPEMKDLLTEAREILEQRKTLLEGLDEGRNLADPGKIKLTALSDKRLTPARISEFAAHPRLDLYVGPNSKHPAEKFGCTSCHGGQPSGTSFTFAAHTPNDTETLKRWKKDHDWESQHMWDFPMQPQRFAESSCLKCHHQVTDLYSDGNKSEAPKLIKGFNLIREYGCFGCHEINGYKGGRQVGPDLRLEPNPPLEQLTPAQRAKLLSDPDNPPGTFRKVGPNLSRVTEKTYKEWAVKWITAPREFRPDTKMPHYYGLSNNDAHALAGTGQETFPATEAHGIAHYLFKASNKYLDDVDDSRKPEVVKEMEATVEKLDRKLNNKEKLTEAETKDLQNARYVLSLRSRPQRLSDAALGWKGDAVKGRDLFSKKGCLACHSHASTNEADDDNKLPALPSEADFGPNLTQLKEKLVNKETGKTDKATIWLVNWLLNPTIHSPRTRMPITHLTEQEAASIAAWLLAQDIPTNVTEDLQSPHWKDLKVPAPDEEKLKKLTRVYLDPLLAESEVKKVFEGELGEYRANDLGVDEKELVIALKKVKGREKERQEALLEFVGKKAIGRLGCFACHDIPGFESYKPIGTALNEWGKKDPTRLAFEDIASYVKEHYPKDKGRVVNSLVDEDGAPRSVAKGPLYESFFYDALMHESRDGYLNQKLLEPRSFDFNRIRTWTDRSRMPQFQLARVKMKPPEEDVDFNARKQWTEAMGGVVDPDAKPRKAESPEDFEARRNKQEADNREAVMTFVLGLVAEPIPLQYVNRPGPDRMAEVKGRQVLDKFNCAGCHIVRPGAYEFKLSPQSKSTASPGIRGELKTKSDGNKDSQIYLDDHVYPEHRAWSQPTQTGDVFLTHGVHPKLVVVGKTPRVRFILTEALKLKTVVRDDKGNFKPEDLEFRAQDSLALAPRDLIWPPQSALRSTDAFDVWKKAYGTEGGAFAALLSRYLKPPEVSANPDSDAGPYVPPLLIWQGERTQPDWLFQFLLNPTKVRELTVLRMPKFNMSEDEARTVVDYFAAIEKRFNPDTGLVYPYPKVPQRGELDSDFWRAQTKKYIDELDPALYKKEVAAYRKAWERMREDWKTELKNADQRKKTAVDEEEKVDKALAKAKGDKQKEEALKKDKDQAKLNADFWKAEHARIDDDLKKKTLPVLEKDWRETQAYALAGYRLVVNQCTQCHKVGQLTVSNVEGQGPSLNLASARLRPEWVKRWISNPDRFLPYVSKMPRYFPTSEATPKVPWFPGTDRFPGEGREAREQMQFEQIEGARNAVLNLPRIIDLPLTRYWMQAGGQ